MKKAESKEYKDLLVSLRARLRGDVNQLADAALKKNRAEANGDLSSMPIHMADLGSDNFEQEFTLSLMENEEGTLDGRRNGAGTNRSRHLRRLRRVRRENPQVAPAGHPLHRPVREVRLGDGSQGLRATSG